MDGKWRRDVNRSKEWLSAFEESVDLNATIPGLYRAWACVGRRRPIVAYIGNLIHPDSELRFVNPAIGYGLFATRPIPKGSITWAADALDQIISPARLAALPEILSRQVHRYSYLNGRGDRILCWDHGRFVNHSCAASCLSPGFDFEIAVRDIAAGEQLTDDYGTLNPEEPFLCLCDAPNCRGQVLPDDPSATRPSGTV